MLNRAGTGFDFSGSGWALGFGPESGSGLGILEAYFIKNHYFVYRAKSGLIQSRARALT